MNPIKVYIYKKPSFTYVQSDRVEESFQDCHLIIYNLTVQQKDKVLELLDTFGDIVKQKGTII